MRKFLAIAAVLALIGVTAKSSIVPQTGPRLYVAAGGGGVAFAPNRPGGLTNVVDRQWNPTDGTIPGGVLPPATLSGSWICVEWLMIRETTAGTSADGVIKFWVNNTLRGHWTNINFNAASGDPVGFDTVSFTPYYGGGGGAAPSDQYIGVGRFLVAVN